MTISAVQEAQTPTSMVQGVRLALEFLVGVADHLQSNAAQLREVHQCLEKAQGASPQDGAQRAQHTALTQRADDFGMQLFGESHEQFALLDVLSEFSSRQAALTALLVHRLAETERRENSVDPEALPAGEEDAAAERTRHERAARESWRGFEAEVGFLTRRSPARTSVLIKQSELLVEHMPHLLGSMNSGRLHVDAATGVLAEALSAVDAPRDAGASLDGNAPTAYDVAHDLDASIPGAVEKLKDSGTYRWRKFAREQIHSVDPENERARERAAFADRHVAVQPLAHGMAMLKAKLSLHDAHAIDAVLATAAKDAAAAWEYAREQDLDNACAHYRLAGQAPAQLAEYAGRTRRTRVSQQALRADALVEFLLGAATPPRADSLTGPCVAPGVPAVPSWLDRGARDNETAPEDATHGSTFTRERTPEQGILSERAPRRNAPGPRTVELSLVVPEAPFLAPARPGPTHGPTLSAGGPSESQPPPSPRGAPSPHHGGRRAEAMSLAHGSRAPASVPGLGVTSVDAARDFIAKELDRGSRLTYRRVFAHPETGELLAMDSRARAFPAGLAKLVTMRDDRCRGPYCDARISQIDHVGRWADGGHTSWSNAQGLCQRCNLAKESMKEVISQGQQGTRQARGTTWVTRRGTARRTGA